MFVVLTAVKLKSGVVFDVFAKLAGELSVIESMTLRARGIVRSMLSARVTKRNNFIFMPLPPLASKPRMIFNISLFPTKR
jgi:hypothetical protein